VVTVRRRGGRHDFYREREREVTLLLAAMPPLRVSDKMTRFSTKI
jgi:hypothetical protein